MAQIGLSMAFGQQTHRGNNCVLGLEARSGAFKGTAFTSLDTVADGQAQQMGASWGKQDWESRGRGGERMEGKGSGWLEGEQGLGSRGRGAGFLLCAGSGISWFPCLLLALLLH